MDSLIFIYLAIFPFGKLFGNLSDLVVAIIVFVAFLTGIRFKVNNFILICVFSLIFSLSFFKFSQISIGVLYLLRFFFYVCLSRVIYLRFGKNTKSKTLIFHSLIAIGILIAVFGWIQYFIFPDLRALKVLGWDDHYFRLVSTFLDPAFTGILLVLAEILLIVKTMKKKTWFNYTFNLFLVFTILFTYSRASYLALFFGVLFLFFKFKDKFLIFLLGVFLLLIPILPKQSGGEGVNLARTYTIVDKFVNYKESIELIKKSPIFGIGFNNVCVATQNNAASHSCGGLDNSILFVVATTGLAGLFIFGSEIYFIIRNTKFDLYGWGLMASFVAIFVHGMFTETFFYSFILGWIAILIGITREEVRG